jgi:hypothetical protein
LGVIVPISKNLHMGIVTLNYPVRAW